MKHFYSNERSIQIVVSLLKQHNIKKIVASPGATNITLVGSLMHDSWFEIYSSVDERSAAYIACGLAAESGEPVVLTCTGATASRNYIPGLTEAYYRKLPILAITSTQDENRIGHLVAQVIDRSVIQNDIALLSEHIPACRDENDEWNTTIRMNRAILELRHHGGGPVHVNLQTTYSRDFSVEELPVAKCIHRIMPYDKFPKLPQGRIGIFVGSHVVFTKEQTYAIDGFCEKFGSVVFCDHTSNYSGKYRFHQSLLGTQSIHQSGSMDCELFIHIGEVSGNYVTSGGIGCAKEVWRVSEDGEIRDLSHKLTNVFEMREMDFFNHYVTSKDDEATHDSIKWLQECKAKYKAAYDTLPELPFGNIWIAKQTTPRLPKDSYLHLGILNTLRSWNLFETDLSIYGSSNTGGFGIDGILSTCVGASLAHPDKLHFCVLGDLSFFYDMNVAGNRHVGNNLRILMVNNGKGTEFRIYNHPGDAFGDEADEYIAAARHYGNKSPKLIKGYAESLGYEYMSATTKEEFLKHVERFVTPELTDKPMLFEVFTNSQDESSALYETNHLAIEPSDKFKKNAQIALNKILPEEAVDVIKKIVK